MADPQISVIIPLWNGRSYIDACLGALFAAVERCEGPVEILVVDNGSTDDSALRAEAHFPTVCVIHNGCNLGFAAGCNVGMRAAHGETLVLLNQDTEVSPAWLSTLAATVDERSVVGSLAFLADGQTIQHAGGRVEWPLGIAHHLGYGEPLTEKWQRPAEVDFVTAAAMAFPRRLLDDIGLFDERFWPGYYEDTDFCYRAREVGYSIRYQPDAILIHQEHSSFRNRLFTQWARLRGRLRFCLKHQTPAFFLDHFLPTEEIHLESVLSGDVGATVAVAYLEAIPMLVDLWQTRATPEQIRQAALQLEQFYAPQPFYVPVDKSGDNPISGGDNLKPTQLPDPILTPSPIERLPILGPVWRRLRQSLHQLVIFYVAQRQNQQEGMRQQQAEEIERLKAELAQFKERSSE
ncbi:MAG: glycosyltransferase [Caldilineaceae bacterium]|nr:glycosyltransferase [Caldilineaceae bacterium]